MVLVFLFFPKENTLVKVSFGCPQTATSGTGAETGTKAWIGSGGGIDGVGTTGSCGADGGSLAWLRFHSRKVGFVPRFNTPYCGPSNDA